MAEATVESRIAQFQKMANDDAGNELGHYSLGRAYLDAGRDAEAIQSLERALSLNPNLSRAYQLVGTALLRQGQQDAAIAQMTEGVKKADERGDVLPRTEMIQSLKELVRRYRRSRAARWHSQSGRARSNASGAAGLRRISPGRHFAIRSARKYSIRSAPIAGAKRSAWGPR